MIRRHLTRPLIVTAAAGIVIAAVLTSSTIASAHTTTSPAQSPVAAARYADVPLGGASNEARAAILRSPQARVAASFYRPFETGDTRSYTQTLATNWADLPLNPGQGPGRAGAVPVVQGFHTSFPDLRITIDAIYVDGDTVTVRTTFRATQAGAILGVPGTGRHVEFRTTDVHQIHNGQIVRSDHLEDLFGLYSQITG